jgi:hypothetical protein
MAIEENLDKYRTCEFCGVIYRIGKHNNHGKYCSSYCCMKANTEKRRREKDLFQMEMGI